MARSPGRPKISDPALTREAILQTALHIIDTEGVAACSMRRVASDLGVDPMALYHHVANKQALLSGVVELAFADFAINARPTESWQAQVRAFAHAYYQLTRDHTHLTLYMVTDTQASAGGVLKASEQLYAALAQAGLSPAQIVQAADVLVDYLNGFALAAASGKLGQPDERNAFLHVLACSPPDQFPTLRRVWSNPIPTEALASIESGLTLILAGIEAMAIPIDNA